jgi:hypothetical protein
MFLLAFYYCSGMRTEYEIREKYLNVAIFLTSCWIWMMDKISMITLSLYSDHRKNLDNVCKFDLLKENSKILLGGKFLLLSHIWNSADMTGTKGCNLSFKKFLITY